MPDKREILRLKNVQIPCGCRIDLCVHRGEIVGIVGESASGKSVLARIMSGAEPSGGEILIDNERVKEVSELSSRVVYVGATDKTLSGLCVAENIFLGRSSAHAGMLLVNERRLHAAARALLSRVRLCRVDTYADVLSLYPSERKLLEIARALSREPCVLVLDGIFCVLEHSYRKKLKRILEEFKRNGGAAVFFTRDMGHTAGLCDRVYRLNADGVHSCTEQDARECEPVCVKGKIADAGMERPIYMRVVNLCVEGKLSNISFRLGGGEILGIVGLSCSGIHTLGRALYGACELERGRVSLGGVSIRNVRSALRCGMLYASEHFGREDLTASAIEKANVFVLDSILSGIDTEERAKARSTLHSIRQSGRSAVIISEDIDVQMELCDRILVLYRGRIVGEMHASDGYNKRSILALATGESV